MPTRNDGGQAFPISRSHFATDGKLVSVDWLPGMTLRAWLAGQALNGFASRRISNFTPEQMAARCCAYADALIAELDKPK